MAGTTPTPRGSPGAKRNILRGRALYRGRAFIRTPARGGAKSLFRAGAIRSRQRPRSIRLSRSAIRATPDSESGRGLSIRRRPRNSRWHLRRPSATMWYQYWECRNGPSRCVFVQANSEELSRTSRWIRRARPPGYVVSVSMMASSLNRLTARSHFTGNSPPSSGSKSVHQA